MSLAPRTTAILEEPKLSADLREPAMVEIKDILSQIQSEPAGELPHSGCGSCGSGSNGDGGERCGNGLEKIYPTTAVRFGFMRYIGEFTHAPEMKFTCGAKVVVQTQRGIEIGDQVSLSCSGCDKSVTRDEIKSWVRTSGEDTYMFNTGRILREATAADLAEYARIKTGAREKCLFAKQTAREHKLPLDVVECECPFGGERVIFYFTAAERVDFRAMVKDLAREYRTRIEMRQIGARDEARLLADFETCGREVCCKVFLKTLKPISMRMAKVQKATLDPSQVSGRCGRLKCCLRYEHTGYEELDKLIPKVGKRIRTMHGEGVVVNRQIITQIVQIRLDTDAVVSVVQEDILAEGQPMPEQPKPPAPPQERGARDGKPRDSSSRDRTSRPPRQRPRKRRPDSPGQSPKPAAEPAPPGEAKTGQSTEDQPPQRRRRRRRRRRGSGGTGAPQGDSPKKPPES